MAKLVRVNKNFSIDQDFWELNPQLTIIAPFSKLHPKENSSKYMWAIFFMCDPDEEDNKLFRLPLEERKQVIKENYVDIDWEDTLIQECLEEYPYTCMDSIERALKDEKDSLVARAKLIRETTPTLDQTIVLGDKAVQMKGTATQLDTMRAKTLKIYEEFEKVLEKFKDHKSEEARVYGGRKESAAEKGLI